MFAELIRDSEHTRDDTSDLPCVPAVDGPAWPSDAAVWTAADFDSADSAKGPNSIGSADSADSADSAKGPNSIGSIGSADSCDGAGRVAETGCTMRSEGGARPAPGPHGGADAEPCALGALSYTELQDRVVELVAERNRIEGEYLAALGELTSRYGTQAAAYVLRDQTRMNGAQARSESRLAEGLREHGLADTLDAMRAGEIHMAHAKVIVRESPKKHRRGEASFLGLCRAYPSDTVARHTLAYESEQVYADLAAEAAAGSLDPVDAELALQRHQRRASMRCGDDGMWDLRGRFDFLTGRQLSITLQAAVRSARHKAHSAEPAGSSAVGDSGAGDSAARGAAARDLASGGLAAGHAAAGEGARAAEPTTAQLTADALAGLICGTPTARRSNAGLVLVADYDVVNDRLANPRLDDGTPISPKILADLTLEPLPAAAGTAPSVGRDNAHGHVAEAPHARRHGEHQDEQPGGARNGDHGHHDGQLGGARNGDHGHHDGQLGGARNGDHGRHDGQAGSARNGRLDCPVTPQRHTAEQTADYAVVAKVLPAVFSADWSQLALGTARNANDAQRLILALRDGGCISCELTAEHTEAHHIRYHEQGGPTDVPNLASLCRPCHKDLHNHQRQIHTPTDGRPRLRPLGPTTTTPPEPIGAGPPEPSGASSPEHAGASPPAPADNDPPSAA